MNTTATVPLGILWRVTAQKRDGTPPFNALPPFEIRALSEALALERIAALRPDLEILSIERRPSGCPPASSRASC